MIVCQNDFYVMQADISSFDFRHVYWKGVVFILHKQR